MDFLFIETTAFSRARLGLMQDDELQEFQAWLLENYGQGKTMSGTGGCKKVRWQRPGTGKSGGVRVIYFARTQQGRIYLLIIYPKSWLDNLSARQKAQLKAAVELLS